MTVNNAVYAPTLLKVQSVGIGIGDDTLAELNMSATQHLMVAETRTVLGDDVYKQYGLIVDKTGIGVNCGVLNRAAQSNAFAAYVEGNVFVNGTITACNIISDGGLGGVGGGGSTGTSNYWLSRPGDREAIYYPGRISVGTLATNTAINNTHAVNVIESADRSIDHAQISVQNTQGAQFRMGILGTSNLSPAVINTRPGSAIEFHAARAQNYFSNVYLRPVYRDGVSGYGLYHDVTETPVYSHTSNSPHMLIDTAGNVGIHTGAVPAITYTQSKPVSTVGGVTFPTLHEPAALHVDGTTFSSNLVVWDGQFGGYCNIDALYIRRLGATINANQIIPGPFANGPYIFPDKLGVGAGNPDPNFALTVNGSERITSNLKVDRLTEMDRMIVNDAVMLDVASFCNDVYVNRDMIIKESLRLRAGLFTEVHDGSNTYWCNVQFTVAQSGFSNINYIGTGISTPGRLGVGIDPRLDEVNHQLVVTKRSGDIYELQMLDKSNPQVLKMALIGHIAPDATRANDASLVFSTPGATDTDFSVLGNPMPQNFYFYPGQSFASLAEPIVREDNPPTLNVHTSSRVGILTFEPVAELDVRGSIAFSGDIYKIDNTTATITSNTPTLGIWLKKTYAIPPPATGAEATFRGMEYNDAAAPYVGVNCQPDIRYGMVVEGGLKADVFYDAENREVAHWYHSTSTSNMTYTLDKVGIGLTDAARTLTVRDNWGDATSVRLVRSIDDPTTMLEFAGIYEPWTLRADDMSHRLEFMYGSNVPSANDTRALWMKYDPLTQRQQVVVGGNLGIFDHASNTRPMADFTVGGDVSVVGDVYVSGRYFANGQVLINGHIASNTPLPTNNDDVFIGGNRIFVNPADVGNNKGFFAIGYTTEKLAMELAAGSPFRSDNTPFRIYQSDAYNPTIARFSAQGANALLSLANNAGDILQFGIYQNNLFAFLDKNLNSYMTFAIAPDASQRYMGLNQHNNDDVTASMHIHNHDTGSNMLRLTRHGAGDTNGACPAIELENEITMATSIKTKRWRLSGPDVVYGEKLVLAYNEDEEPLVERFTFTSNGCLGFGNTTPEFAVDIVGEGKLGSIRMLNRGDKPTPQLIFQSDSNVFGSDESTDYRMFSSNNHFVLDMQNRTDYKRLLDFGPNGNLGLLSDSDPRYALNVGGVLNVATGILLNGSALQGSGGDGFNVNAANILLSPFLPEYGGVAINSAVPTSNLFYVLSGNNANVGVFDSTFDKAYIHFRARDSDAPLTANMYRVGISNHDFIITYHGDCGTDLAISDSSERFTQAMTLTPSSNIVGAHDMKLTVGGQFILGADGEGLHVEPGTSQVVVNTDVRVEGILTAPLLEFLESSNVAIATPAWDVLNFATAGAERMRIDATGNVGIGTSVVGTARLNVWDVASALPALTVATCNEAVPSITANHRACVGIGTMAIFRDDGVVLSVDGDSHFRGHVLPVVNDTFDLGTDALRWRSVKLGTSADIGALSLTSNLGKLSIYDTNTSTYGGVMAEYVTLSSNNTILDLQINETPDQSPLVFSKYDVITNESTVYIPVVRTSNESGFGINTSNVTAALHIMGSCNLPALIVDYTSNEPFDYVAQIKMDGMDVLDVFSDGSVGIGTTVTGHAKLMVTLTPHDVSSNSIVNVLELMGVSNVVEDGVEAMVQMAQPSVVVDGQGRVGIGSTQPSAPLDVADFALFGSNVHMMGDLDVEGDIRNNGNVVTSSDVRFKTNLTRIENGLEKVKRLTGYTFDRIGRTQRATGLVAQEVAAVLPEAIVPDNAGYLHVAYGNMMGLMVEAIKDLAREIEELKSQCACRDPR